MKIVRKKLTPDELIPKNTRYNADCDCIEVTPDNGSTWNELGTGSDPRHGAGFLKPARTGVDARCDAAENMSSTLKKNISDIILAVNVGAIGTSMMVDFAFLSTGVGFFADLALIIAEGIVALTLTAIEAAFTDAVYAQLTNIFFCDIADDGRVSAAELAQIESDVSAQIGGLVSVVFNLYMSLWGEVGLSNAGATGAAVGSCGSFDCSFCYTVDFTVTDGADVGVEVVFGTFGGGLNGVFVDSNNKNTARIQWFFPERLHIVRYESVFNKGGGSGASDVNLNRLYTLSPTVLQDTDAANPFGNDQVKNRAYTTDADMFDADINTGTGDFSCTLLSVTIHYTRATPLWTENC